MQQCKRIVKAIKRGKTSLFLLFLIFMILAMEIKLKRANIAKTEA